MQRIGDVLEKQVDSYVVIRSPTSTEKSLPDMPEKKHDLWHGFQFYCQELKKAKRQLVRWYQDGFDKGEALLLAGPPGAGKTHLALVVQAACGGGYRTTLSPAVFMIGEADLLTNIRASYDGDGTEKMILAQYRRCPLLILDDLGTGYVKDHSRDWLESIYWRIFDRRSVLGLPMLITTNLDIPELSQRLGGRAFSRLQGMMGNDGNYIDLFGVDDYRTRGWTP